MSTFYDIKIVKVNRLTVGQKIEYNHNFYEIESISTDKKQENFTIRLVNASGAIYKKGEDVIKIQISYEMAEKEL